MIKRRYFVKMTAASNKGGKDHRFRVFTRTSWLPQDSEALRSEIELFALFYNVQFENVTVDSFNRL